MTIRMGIYGDSIGTGWRGISDRSKRWTSITCTNLNLEEHNFSVDGLGFIRRRDTGAFLLHPLQMVIDAQPQIALIALGQNDYECIPDREDELRRVMLQDMTALRDALPESQVLVVEPYWPSTRQEPPKGRRVFDLHGACAEEAGLPFVKGQRGVFGEDYLPYLFPEEGQLHPNDEGHAVLAAVMTEALSPYVQRALERTISLPR
ncbi:SGNH/GDSL hydrolase family protein [Arthrobacter bussei]|uniref:SGNH/GDSL hydrolase family protein n=1 Tax=Arthrobacter bussei TaxID=2594179 RepID=A0A7X1TQ20_9MICC|nr:SGNH/GDSL hydrolase family protein [Arthrobacter bussei]MPY12220.1 SGNH/GDSL hydrolase family protein [Arthrobacter bussei]